MQTYGFHQYMPAYPPPPPTPPQRRDLAGGYGSPATSGVQHVPQATTVMSVNNKSPSSMNISRSGSDLVTDFRTLSMNGEVKSSKSNSSSTFRWRLDAPEFIPQALRHSPVNQQQHPSAVDYGGGGGAGSYGTPTMVTTAAQHNDQLQCFLWELVNWLTHLYMDPGNFDIIARQISNQMNYTVRCERDLQTVVDKFFEISMSYPHFSYHAARLCVSFNARFNAMIDDANMFRRVLLKRCAQMMDARLTMMDDSMLQSQLHNFLMFLAELCVQFMDQGRPMKVVVGSIFQLISEMLLRAGDLNVRCCISALKCCGPFLQHHASEELTKILDMMHSDSVLKTLSANLILAVESLTTLRAEWQRSSLQMLTMAEADNWAKNVAESAANSVLDQSDSLPLAPVYYGPDGVPLTNEETAFLAELDQQGSGDEDLPPTATMGQGDVLSEDDMIAEAYEQFLEMQKDAKQHN